MPGQLAEGAAQPPALSFADQWAQAGLHEVLSDPSNHTPSYEAGQEPSKFLLDPFVSVFQIESGHGHGLIPVILVPTT